MAPALGLLRLNERKQRPNPAINFIKPLDGPDFDTAHDFLSRVAAIATPITRKYYINVMSLEEFPPNREFWGRNFNNGESRAKEPEDRQVAALSNGPDGVHARASPRSSNESWAGVLEVTDAAVAELRGLWAKSFTGEGLWGRGRALYSGQYSAEEGLPDAERDMVAQTCGGTFRGFRGKRRRQDKSKLSYAEQKERRIKKKFGEGGQALGDDEETRLALEKGKKTKGKPRIAGSNRGRELRAAAALRRFDTEKATMKIEDEDDADETEYGSDLDDSTAGPSAKGANGEDLMDAEGLRLVRVCEGEDDSGEDARREMEELGALGGGLSLNDRTDTPGSRGTPLALDEANISTASEDEEPANSRSTKNSSVSSTAHSKATDSRKPTDPQSSATSSATAPGAMSNPQQHARRLEPEKSCMSHSEASSTKCAVCTIENDPQALTCVACSNVLHPDRLASHWRCSSDACQGSVYINAGDAGFCGICGTNRP